MSRVLSAVWRGLNLAREIFFNVIFLLILVLIVVALSGDGAPEVPDGGALVVAPGGVLVEQRSADPVQQAINDAMGQGEPQTLLRELVGAIEDAAQDSKIKVLVLRLDNFLGGALPQLQEVAGAIERFKESGKPVIALGGSYSQAQYFLAAHADEILMHPLGSVDIRGLGFNRLYYKELSDKLGVDWNVVRVGEFKSAVEPMIRNDMSPEARENYSNLLGDLWSAYESDIVAARGLDEQALSDYVAGLVEGMEQHRGDMAELAVTAGLVDRLATREEMRQRIIEITGPDEEEGGYRGISAKVYAQLSQAKRLLGLATRDNRIAVIVASGVIKPGKSEPGSIGGDELAQRILDAARDERVKAVVLRVDSPGGSAFASDVIHDAVQAVRDQGKPVVVSMSGVAASGGYWISMGADEIWAYPGTVTGSIGVFGSFPTVEKALGKLGVHTDGVATTWIANEFSPLKSLSPRARELAQLAVQNIYHQFVTQVADYRGLDVEAVKAIAGGRVWSGADAHELGLVDQLGGLTDAVRSAAELAGLEEKSYAVDYRERKLSFQEQLLINMFSATGPALQGALAGLVPAMPHAALLEQTGLRRELELLFGGSDSAPVFAYCFCRIEW